MRLSIYCDLRTSSRPRPQPLEHKVPQIWAHADAVSGSDGYVFKMRSPKIRERLKIHLPNFVHLTIREFRTSAPTGLFRKFMEIDKNRMVQFLPLGLQLPEPVLREIENWRQREAIFSPSSKRATKRIRSSITEHSFHGISTPFLLKKAKSVTYVSGTNCHPCVGSLTGK